MQVHRLLKEYAHVHQLKVDLAALPVYKLVKLYNSGWPYERKLRSDPNFKVAYAKCHPRVANFSGWACRGTRGTTQ